MDVVVEGDHEEVKSRWLWSYM